MKLTICFDDIKVIVPCNRYEFMKNNSYNDSMTPNINEYILKKEPKISDIIENAISRYKKATNKV
jgi:hypothetical protein